MKKAIFHQKIIDEGIAEAAAKKKSHKIGWLNLPGYKGETWNPIIGCSKVSPGCENCYAEKMAVRLAHNPKTPQYKSVIGRNVKAEKFEWIGSTRLVIEKLAEPLHWRKPRVVFVCSMGDLFHESVSFDEINAVFSVMADNDKHIYIVLTKRPERLIQYIGWKEAQHGIPWEPKPNVWMGVTAENQEQAEKRIPALLDVKAAVRFVSIEPMLGPVNLTRLNIGVSLEEDVLNGKAYSLGEVYMDGSKLDWVICGGESGHNARPMHPDWVRSLCDQCKAANVPFFFKQWGEFRPAVNTDNYPIDRYVSVQKSGKYRPSITKFIDGHLKNIMVKCGKKQAGHQLDGEVVQQYTASVHMNF